MKNIEEREHGLRFIKGTQKLVTGQVVERFPNGNIAAIHNFKDGKMIGDWAAYDQNGNVISNGFGVEIVKYEKNLPALDLSNSILSVVIQKGYNYSTLYLDNPNLFENEKLLIGLSKLIFKEYLNQYKIDVLFIFDKGHEYTIRKSAILHDRYKIDSIKTDNKLKLFFD